MGEVDIAVLHPIYRECVYLVKEHRYPFQFKEDSGSYETMIEFKMLTPPLVKSGDSQIIPIHPPQSSDWYAMKLINSIPICPDILDFEHRIIIEYEEDSKPGKSSGKLGKKGHWAESKRDTRRDEIYKLTNFRYCKIWEFEIKNGFWMQKLFHFLADCYCNRDTSKYLDEWNG